MNTSILSLSHWVLFVTASGLKIVATGIDTSYVCMNTSTLNLSHCVLFVTASGLKIVATGIDISYVYVDGYRLQRGEFFDEWSKADEYIVSDDTKVRFQFHNYLL